MAIFTLPDLPFDVIWVMRAIAAAPFLAAVFFLVLWLWVRRGGRPRSAAAPSATETTTPAPAEGRGPEGTP